MRYAAALVLALALSAPASAGREVPRGFFGVSAAGVMFEPVVDLQREFTLMNAVGVESIITEFAWSVEQPEEGKPPDFSRTDPMVLAAAARRMPVMAIAVFAPGWAA